jgi:hypothetical protein
MFNLRSAALIASAVIFTAAYGQSNEFATGNMHFSAHDADTNGDHMITREEMQKYAEKLWDEMAHGKKTIPIATAAQDFATGGMNLQAREIDSDHDGTISKEEFLAYMLKKFDGMKNAHGMVPVDDLSSAFARGNMPSGH